MHDKVGIFFYFFISMLKKYFNFCSLFPHKSVTAVKSKSAKQSNHLEHNSMAIGHKLQALYLNYVQNSYLTFLKESSFLKTR